MMTNLPPELQRFAAFLAMQPSPLQTAFQYCLCRMMEKTGKMELIETVPEEHGALSYIFATATGDTFSITKPAISRAQEAALIQHLRIILDEEL